MTKWFKKVWNILNGSDKNWDGTVDIHDKMIAAEEKTQTSTEDKQEKEK
jgi:hypothetical protein|tara:strand:+ start:967 stop:1113 length:147 start_codon:yes stop_codon:yes gene_type:complete